MAGHFCAGLVLAEHVKKTPIEGVARVAALASGVFRHRAWHDPLDLRPCMAPWSAGRAGTRPPRHIIRVAEADAFFALPEGTARHTSSAAGGSGARRPPDGRRPHDRSHADRPRRLGSRGRALNLCNMSCHPGRRATGPCDGRGGRPPMRRSLQLCGDQRTCRGSRTWPGEDGLFSNLHILLHPRPARRPREACGPSWKSAPRASRRRRVH